MAKTTYVIREAYYDYDSEKPVFVGWAKVVERVDSEAKAKKRVQELQRSRYSWIDGRLDRWTWADAKKQSAVIAILERALPKPLAAAREEAGTDDDSRVLSRFEPPDPEKVKPAVQDALMEAAGALFFKAFAFEGEPELFKPEIQDDFYGSSSSILFGLGEESFPWLCNTREEAEDRACAHLYRWQIFKNPFNGMAYEEGARNPPGLQGSYAKLSKDPKALQALIEKNKKVFKVGKGTLEVLAKADEATYTKALKALVPLLRKPPYLIRTLSFEEASKAKAKR